MNVPAARPVYTTAYENFKGVDFTSQRPDRNRFPEACNIEIADHVKKRPGYGRISIKCGGEEITDEIKVIKFMKFNNEPYYFVQAGNVLYWGKSFDSMEEVKTNSQVITSDEAMNFIECDNKVYILTGEDIYEIAYREDEIASDETIGQGKFNLYVYFETATTVGSLNFNAGYQVCTDGNNLYNQYDILYYKNISDSEFPFYSRRFFVGKDTLDSSYYKIKNGKPYLCYIDIRRSTQIPSSGDGLKDTGFAYVPCYAKTQTIYPAASGLDDYAEIYSSVFNEDTILNEEVNLLTEYRRCDYIQNTGSNQEFILPDDCVSREVLVQCGERSPKDWLDINASVNPAYGYYYVSVSQTRTPSGTHFRIYYKSKYAKSSFESHYLKISTVCSNMIYGNGNYYFLVGKAKKNADYHSEVNDMTYFKGSSYQMYGNSDEILGYGQLGESLCVIKKNGSDNSMCLRTSAEVSGLGTVFPVSYCLGGAALGVSKDSIKNLNGEVLYLSQTGIKALTGLSLLNSKVTSDRSYYINGKLLKEENLKDAKCVIHKDKYYLGINGNVYILDASKPKDYINQTANEYSYEALFWDNIPASCFYSDGENLYFGGKNGGLFKFIEGKYLDDTEPTKCFVATVFDDDGDFMSLKKIKKKGTGVLAKPFSRSTIDILYRYDDNNEKALKPFYPQYFDFNDIDFSRFTFYTSDRPQVIPFMKKSKKYKSLQFVLKSDADEPFAFLGIIKRYEIVNYVKRM